MNKLKSLFFVAAIIFSALLFPPPAQAQPVTPGKLTIFGIEYTGDGLAPGWTNGSLYNGVNTWNIIDTETFYAGTHSLSWTAAASFERGWVVSPTALNIGQYQYLNFYAKAKQLGQRYEVGFVKANGDMVGTWVMVDSGGGPIQPDRWQLYSWPLSAFNVTSEVFGIGFRDVNGGPQPKVFFDEIQLADTPGTQPIISQGLGQPNVTTIPPKPKGPYSPTISPWVFIIPAIIIMLAIFFE